MTDIDLIAEVATRITNAEREQSRSLDLSNLEISTGQMRDLIRLGLMEFNPTSLNLSGNDMQELPVEIGLLTDLEDLSISNNSLQTLPDGIGLLDKLQDLISVDNPGLNTLPNTISEMTSLRNLYMPNNGIRVLPDAITLLPNLEEINVSGNGLESLPNNIGNMPALRDLQANNNRLLSLPDSLGNSQSIETINVSRNQIVSIPDSFRNLTNLQSFNLFQNDSLVIEQGNPLLTFDEGVVFSEHPAFERGYDENVVLQEMYGENAEAVASQIQNLDPSVTYPLGNSDLPPAPASEVIETFLKQIPSFDEFDREFYVPAGKDLIDNALDQNSTQEERNTAISKIASSLGNCPTPVKSLLLQTAIGMNANAEGDLPEQLKTAIEREALEEKIVAKLGNQLRDNEKIEQVQALVNSIFLENAEQRPNNIVKIAGDRARIPSKTSNVEFGFRQITPEVAQSFAAICCETDTNDKPLQINDKYILDPVKYKQITEPYFAKLGIVSDVEKLVGKFENGIQSELSSQMDLVSEHYDKADVKPLIDINSQKADLRKELFKSPKANLQEVSDNFLVQKKAAIKQVVKKYLKEESKEAAKEIKKEGILQQSDMASFLTAQPTAKALASKESKVSSKTQRVGKGSTVTNNMDSKKPRKKGI